MSYSIYVVFYVEKMVGPPVERADLSEGEVGLGDQENGTLIFWFGSISSCLAHDPR